MKKITLLLMAIGFSFATQAQERVLSHSESQVPAEGSVACAANDGTGSTENNFWRSYTPADFGETGTISIQGGEVAVSVTEIFGGLPVNIALVAYISDDVFPAGELIEIASGNVLISASDDLTVVPFEFDTPVNVDSGTEIILKMAIPDGTLDGFDLRIGQNSDGETAPTYISTDTSCGPLPITTFEDLGFDGNGILNLTVSDVVGVNDNSIAGVSIYPNPTSDVLYLKMPSNIEVNSVALFDLLGKKVNVDYSNESINMAALSQGVYLLKVETSAGNLTQKIVKQ